MYLFVVFGNEVCRETMPVRHLCNFNDIRQEEREIYINFGPISNSIILTAHGGGAKIEC